MNEHRRTFRGRGGATDRQLPKHNARRRRRDKVPKAPNKYASDDARPQESDPLAIPEQVAGENTRAVCSEESFDELLHSSERSIQADTPSEDLNKDGCIVVASEQLEVVDDFNREVNSLFRSEVNHLLRRIRSNRANIQTSSLAMSKPLSYETNVLRAVRNCAKEWRAIIRQYPTEIGVPTTDADGSVSTENATICTAIGLALFELVQLALQCGPLRGAKPGYFKRCGGETAKLVLEFLEDTIEDRQAAVAIYFTEKQADAIEKWKHSASKALVHEIPPSKSVQKRLQIAINDSVKKK
jgi:hypothetical protein